MKVTIDLPDDLAEDLQQFESQSASIVAAGLREVKAASPKDFPGLSTVLEKLAELPSPEEVLALRPSPELDLRVRELLRKGREEGLSEEEEKEWARYETLEHLVRIAKARAHSRLRVPGR